MSENKRETIKNAKKVAGKMYDVTDYEKNDQISKGLAMTHEQATDAYTEGTVQGTIDNVDDSGELSGESNEKIERKGYR